MATGDTAVSICNKALLYLGAEAITSFTDGTLSGNACSILYNDVKRATMSMYSWSFTIKKIELVKEAATPVSEWTNQFAFPSDMLTNVPRAVRNSASPGAPTTTDWEVQQAANGSTVLMTNATQVYIDYQKEVSETLMPHHFVQLLAYQLAWHLAETLTDQTAKADFWRNIALGTPSEGFRGGYFRQAVFVDSAGQTPSSIQDYLLTDVR